MADNCNDNRDSLQLVRDGTSQEQRAFQALDPAYAPVNERTVAHGMVFARQYAAFLKYYNDQNQPSGSWQQFFSDDLSVQLAIAAIQRVDNYRQEVKRYFDFLNDLSNDVPAKEGDCKNRLGYLFSCVASLAARLDELKESLLPDNRLKGALQNMIKSQLAPHFQRFWAYYKHDISLGVNRLIANLPATIQLNTTPTTLGIMGSPALPVDTVYSRTFSEDWIIAGWTPVNPSNTGWAGYKTELAAENGYGSGGTVFARINRLSTHNLFTSIFDQFLRAYARTVAEAKAALEDSLTKYDGHAPHYALFLAFLRLHEYARDEANTLTGRHLDFYYKKVLRLREKPAVPGRAHLLVELAKHASNYELHAGDQFTAGKDELGRDVFFKNDRDFVANKAKVVALKTLYRHTPEPSKQAFENTLPTGRIYASPVANSSDGLGGELVSEDQSWHPFFNKIYSDGRLADIQMPVAELGFAVASHYLFLTEGFRRIALNFELSAPISASVFRATFLVTTAEGWFPITGEFVFSGTQIQFDFSMDADQPAIRPYDPKVHGGSFQTPHPMVKVLLRHQANALYGYTDWQDVVVKKCTILVSTGLDSSGNPTRPGLKTLAASNDFGPIDSSKPFQPFGALPLAGASLIVGHKEVFQKSGAVVTLNVSWKAEPGSTPTAKLFDLVKGEWVKKLDSFALNTQPFQFSPSITSSAPFDYSPSEGYTAAAAAGYLKISLDDTFGHKAWQDNLALVLLDAANKKTTPASLPQPPVTPEISALSLSYSAASNEISLNSATSKDATGAKFFHLTPFGDAEQHPALSGKTDTFLLPQFDFVRDKTKQETVAELYIGIANLRPPQNLSLLFQVADGTANPLADKPKQHIHWSYLSRNEWVPFDKNDVGDQTGDLIHSGIVTLAMPRTASDDNTLLPSGLHWIRLAVDSNSDAVCRLRLVAAQALQASFADAGNDPAFPAKTLPAATINGLDQPDAAVKGIQQPFQTFGGRGQETSADFYTRVSERLRHRDRGVALWDYERLVLEAFPQLYRAKCLPHTQYQPIKGEKASKYRELAPGHVTIITIPNQQQHNLRDPLRPYTSLGLLQEVEAFLMQRMTCFATLHVRNPEFESVWTEFRVRLLPGYDETFYLKKLRQEITRFLSPWAYSDGGSPSFGGKVFKSVLINFVEEQPYVDYVTDFVLRHRYISEKDGTETDSNDLNEITPSKAVSILVSAPESSHNIQPITEAEAEAAREKCPCQA